MRAWCSAFGKPLLCLIASPKSVRGYRFDDDESEGVVNEFGEVWNYPNLYVSDGSIIPTALSVNPSATISALSERIADHIVGAP